MRRSYLRRLIRRASARWGSSDELGPFRDPEKGRLISRQNWVWAASDAFAQGLRQWARWMWARAHYYPELPPGMGWRVETGFSGNRNTTPCWVNW